MAEERVQRRLAAILAADVVGYSRLMGADEAGTLSRLKALRSEVFMPAIKAAAGRVFKVAGDGALAEFRSAADAVDSAVAVQRAMAERNAALPERERIELRIGISLGDVIIEGSDLYGNGVNVAARMEGLANPGGICISGNVHEHVNSTAGLSFDDLGEQQVKNIDRPVHAYRIASRPQMPGPRAPEIDAIMRRPAVAVLPFDNLSRDPEQEYFADGLTEDIITALSRWRSFPVIARNSTFAYKGRSPDVRKIASELGARYVLEGSVRRGGSRVRVTAQLIDAETGHHVWAERYDRELEDIFALQDEMTLRIAAIIEPAIEQAEHRRIAAKRPENLNAWESCVRGFSFIHKATKDDNASARELFRRAIAQDPRYPRAYTGLSYTHLRDVRFGWSESVDQSVESAFAAARQAIALDASDSEPRTMLVRGYQMTGQVDAAIAEGRRAAELNPYDAYTQVVLGTSLIMSPEHREEAISALKKGMELSPQDPQNFQIRTHVAVGYLCTGQYLLAADLARTAARDNPEFIESHIVLAAALGHLDRAEEARVALERFAGAAFEYIERRPNWSADMTSQMLDGLRKAGLRE